MASEGSDASIPYPHALNSSNLSLDRLDDILEYSLILGNGDVTGLLYSDKGQLVLRINKNDVWDSRLETSRDDDLPTLKRVKELAFEEWPDTYWILPRGKKLTGFDSYNDQPYPCPRGCAVVRIGKQDESHPPRKSTLYPLQAKVTCGDSDELRSLAQRNVFLIRTSEPVQLEAIASATLPKAEEAHENAVHWLKQEIPGDLDWPGMHFAVAMAGAGEYTAVAIVTSFESKDAVKAAISLARKTAKEAGESLIREHEKEWQQFWSRSGVELGDPFLQNTWYRNLYFVRCITRQGAMPPGLLAGLMNDTPAWHGDYHTNYNLQQVFWGCYVTNHTELAEPYDRLIADYLPRAKWIARRVFEMDGAYYPHVIYAYEPDPNHCKSRNGRQYLHHLWAMTIGVNGFSVQPLWWRYKYAPNLDDLRETVYPALSEVAIFYKHFIDHCQKLGDEKVSLAPSMSPEHWGWTPQFDRNRNCTFDLAMARYTLAAAIEAATILNRDSQLIEQWRAAIAALPDYPTHGREDETLVVDVQDAPPTEYNIPVPSTPVFPGDVVTWWSPAEQKTLFARTIQSIQWNGNNAMVMLAVARARLSMPGTRDWLAAEVEARLRPNGILTLNRRGASRFNDFGHYAEEFGVVCAISELLLQSVGDIIRVFPAWPVDRPAKFHQLRAQGGFLVSAEIADGVVKHIEITSTVGGVLRMQAPWDISADGKKISRDQIVELQTQAGEKFIFTPKAAMQRAKA